LYMDSADVDVDQPFMEMGLDSVIGVEWIHGLNRKYAVSIQAIQVYDYPNIAKLAGLLEGEIGVLRRSGSVMPSPGDTGAPAPSFESSPSEDRATFVSESVASPRRERAEDTPARGVAGERMPPGTLLDELVASLARALFRSPDEIDVAKDL